MKFIYVTVLLVGVALLTPSRSSALCWSYRNVIGHCNGAGDCQGNTNILCVWSVVSQVSATITAAVAYVADLSFITLR